MSNNSIPWAKILEKHPEANFLQSPEWAKVNTLLGRRTIVKQLGDDSVCLAIIKDAKRGRYLEVPGGPLIDWTQPQAVTAAKQFLIETAQQHKCVFIRLRPQLFKTTANLQILQKMGAKLAPMHLHAEHTVLVDLTLSEDDLLAKMRRQTRYEVRRADKQGVSVKRGNSEALFKEFHQAQAVTAARQHFIPPSLRELLAERSAFGDQAQIYVAYHNQTEPIAYGLVLISGHEAEYFEAASTDLNRKLPGAYAIQWQIIKDLKRLGIERYNLWGIAPANQPKHRYAGVTTFKTGFGGEIVEFVPAHDLIINPAKYALDYTIETLRKKRRHL